MVENEIRVKIEPRNAENKNVLSIFNTFLQLSYYPPIYTFGHLISHKNTKIKISKV